MSYKKLGINVFINLKIFQKSFLLYDDFLKDKIYYLFKIYIIEIEYSL